MTTLFRFDRKGKLDAKSSIPHSSAELVPLEAEIRMTRYFLVLFLMLFNLFWVIVSVTTSIDLTLIGHLRGWKLIHYPKWLNGFIDKKHLGAELLKDCGTHPQVVRMLLLDLLVLFGLIGATIAIWPVVNDLPIWKFWLLDALLYAILLSRLIFFKVLTRRVYRSRSLVD